MTPSLPIVVNGENYDLAGQSIQELLAALGIDGARSGAAVAVNDRVVRRVDWPSTKLAAGDRVEIIAAMQGG